MDFSAKKHSWIFVSTLSATGLLKRGLHFFAIRFPNFCSTKVAMRPSIFTKKTYQHVSASPVFVKQKKSPSRFSSKKFTLPIHQQKPFTLSRVHSLLVLRWPQASRFQHNNHGKRDVTQTSWEKSTAFRSRIQGIEFFK